MPFIGQKCTKTSAKVLLCTWSLDNTSTQSEFKCGSLRLKAFLPHNCHCALKYDIAINCGWRYSSDASQLLTTPVCYGAKLTRKITFVNEDVDSFHVLLCRGMNLRDLKLAQRLK